MFVFEKGLPGSVARTRREGLRGLRGRLLAQSPRQREGFFALGRPQQQLVRHLPAAPRVLLFEPATRVRDSLLVLLRLVVVERLEQRRVFPTVEEGREAGRELAADSILALLVGVFEALVVVVLRRRVDLVVFLADLVAETRSLEAT